MFRVLTLEGLSWQHQLYQMADRQALNLNKSRYFTHCCCKIGRDAHPRKIAREENVAAIQSLHRSKIEIFKLKAVNMFKYILRY